MSAFFKKYWDFITLLGLALFIGGRLPFLYWSFVDDGELILVAQKITAAFLTFNPIEFIASFQDPAIGRFRPAYWVYHWLDYVFFGTNRFGHGAVQLALIIAIVVVIYYLTKKITNSRRAAFLAGLFMVMNRLLEENWYRLGPQEAPMSFFLILGTYALVASLQNVWNKDSFQVVLKSWNQWDFSRLSLSFKNIGISTLSFESKQEKKLFWLACLLMIPGYFMKESSLAFLSFGLLLYILSFLVPINFQLRTKIFWFLVVNILLVVLVRVGTVLSFQEGSYAESYQFSLGKMIISFKAYLTAIRDTFEPLISLIFGSLIIQTIFILLGERVFNRIFIWKIIFLLTGGAFLIILLPWNFDIPRYLFPTFVFFSMFMGIQLNEIFTFFEENIKRNKQIPSLMLGSFGYLFSGLLWIIIAGVVWFNVITMMAYINRISGLSNDYNQKIVANLAQLTAPSGTVYLNTFPGTALELKYELDYHLQLFYQRPDVSVVYFVPEQNQQLKTGDILLGGTDFRQYPEDQLPKNVTFSEDLILPVHLDDPVYYNFMNMVKILPRRLIWNYFTKMPWDFNPIWGYSESNYYWRIKQVK